MGSKLRRRRAAIASAVIGLGLTPAALQAQTPPPPDFRSNARMHVGPLYLNPALQLRELGVDSNVFNSTEDPKSDFTTTLAPQLEMWLPLNRRILVSGMAGSDVVYYATYKNQRSLNGAYTARADITLHRLTFFAVDNLTNTRERPNFEIDIRPRRFEHGIGGGLGFKLHDKLAVELSGRQARLRYDDKATFEGTNLSAYLDRDARAVAVDAGFRITPYTTVGFRGETIRDRFVKARERDGDSVRALPYVTFNPRALIKGTAAVGFRRFTPRSVQVPAFSGLVASAGLAYTLNGSTSFGLTVDRDLTYSFEPSSPYFIQTGFGVSGRRQLVRNFDAIAGVQRYAYAYRLLASPAALLASAGRREITTNYSFDVGYRASRKARIGFGVVSWHRSSNQRADRDYDGLRFRSTAAITF
jgi:hypothetical protein